jgi:hypothetical protein
VAKKHVLKNVFRALAQPTDYTLESKITYGYTKRSSLFDKKTRELTMRLPRLLTFIAGLFLCLNVAFPFSFESLSNKPYLDPDKLDALYSKQMAKKSKEWHIPGHFYAVYGIGSSWNDASLTNNQYQLKAKASIPNRTDTQFRIGYQVNPLLTLDFGQDWVHPYKFQINKNDSFAATLGFNGNSIVTTQIKEISITHFALRLDSTQIASGKNDLWGAAGIARLSQTQVANTPNAMPHVQQITTGYLAAGYTSPINDHVGIDSSLSTTLNQKNIGAYFLMSIGITLTF